MQISELFSLLQSEFPTAELECSTEIQSPYILCNKKDLVALTQHLKQASTLDFTFLESISGVDTGEQLELVYHLLSYRHKHELVIKVRMAYDDLQVPSLTCVWGAANWLEREQYDLFGFHFTDHPDLRRLLLPEDWDGHPLLKSYEYPDEYHGIDHDRPDPLEQFKALDELTLKAQQASQRKTEQAQPKKTAE